jgi:hypothetical protein
MTDKLKDIDYINDDERGYNLIPSFLKDDESIKVLINSFISEIQELYNEAKNYYEKSTINNSFGFMLDQHGERVDLKRVVGQTDEDYLNSIKTDFKRKTSYGSIKQVIDIFKILTNAESVVYDRIGFRTIVLTANVFDFNVNEELIRIKMEEFSAAGVGLILGLKNIGNDFIFSDSIDGLVPSGRGFSDNIDGSDGGQLDTSF